MDELFRRAAENYPLDTNGADWNKVLSALQGQDASQLVPEKKKNKKGRFLWLLLLLPLGFICNRVYNSGGDTNSTLPQAVASKENKATGTNQITSTAKKQLNKARVNINSDDVITIGAEKKYSDPQQEFLSGNQSSNRKNAPSQTSFKGNKHKEVTSFVSAFQQNQNVFTSDVNLSDNANSFSRSYIREIAFGKAKPELGEFVLNKELLPLKNPSDEGTKQNPQTGRRQKKFYIGLIGGMDATTVKFQKIENKGHDFGVLVGYQLNKKWSIEAGSFVENKYYYSEGKYFNTAKIYMPPNSWIKDVSGDCKMIEVPISVKYNFSSRKNSSWFATLGSSSFFMKKEDYTYNYYYGSSGPVAHYKEYKNSSTNLFSNISVTGGYTHKLGRLTDLRIEPYLKIPISGMGIGKLPLLSTGLHVGVIKRF